MRKIRVQCLQPSWSPQAWDKEYYKVELLFDIGGLNGYLRQHKIKSELLIFESSYNFSNQNLIIFFLRFVFRNQSIITYLIIFVVLSIILKFLGVLEISYTELAAYALIFYGIGTVYLSMGQNKRNLLFFGVVSFLFGVELFVTSNYDFFKLSNVVLPSIFFILGTAFFLLFVDDLKNKLLLIVSLIFMASGFFFFAKLGTFNFSDFLSSTMSISSKYWAVIIIITALILILNRNKNN